MFNVFFVSPIVKVAPMHGGATQLFYLGQDDGALVDAGVSMS